MISGKKKLHLSLILIFIFLFMWKMFWQEGLCDYIDMNIDDVIKLEIVFDEGDFGIQNLGIISGEQLPECLHLINEQYRVTKRSAEKYSFTRYGLWGRYEFRFYLKNGEAIVLQVGSTLSEDKVLHYNEKYILMKGKNELMETLIHTYGIKEAVLTLD